jgi:hypothetical protein
MTTTNEINDKAHLDIMAEMDAGNKTYFDCRLSIYDEVKDPIPAFSINDIVVGTKQNFSIITGKAKARKTYFVSALVAAVLSGSYGNIVSGMTGNVLYVDTEQGVSHCMNVLKRIGKASRLIDYDVDSRLVFLTLREENTINRLKLIEQALYDQSSLNLEFVVIDGLRDLVFDINNPQESTIIIDKLLEWTAMFNVHIVCVLHENKINDQLRGHLGTESQNKAEAVIQVEKIDERTSKVEAKFTRNKDFAPFAFIINTEGLPEIGDFEAKEKPLEFDIQLINGIAAGAFKEYEVYNSKLAFNSACKKFYYECTKKTIGDKKAYTMIEVMEHEGIIETKYINARKVEIRKNNNYSPLKV